MLVCSGRLVGYSKHSVVTVIEKFILCLSSFQSDVQTTETEISLLTYHVESDCVKVDRTECLFVFNKVEYLQHFKRYDVIQICASRWQGTRLLSLWKRLHCEFVWRTFFWDRTDLLNPLLCVQWHNCDLISFNQNAYKCVFEVHLNKKLTKQSLKPRVCMKRDR